MRAPQQVGADTVAVKDPFSVNLDCIHCGLCLPKCPTYQELGSEADSPRGRIYLMKAAAQGRIPWDRQAASHIDLCLGCRACESACPSGVRFELMLTQSRQEIRAFRSQGRMRRWALDYLIPHPRRLRRATNLLRFYQGSGAQTVLRRLGLLGLFGARVAQAEAKLPTLPAPLEFSTGLHPPLGRRRHRVGYLWGCVAPALFPQVTRASLDVLRRAGCEVVVPAQQTCCGALHSHDGLLSSARSLARRNIEAFPDDLDALVIDSAGCGAALLDYPHLLSDDSLDHRKAERLASQATDISRFLDEISPDWTLHPVPARVAYDDPCHLVHGQKVSAAPRRLLGTIPELTLLAAPHADRCCGAAGLYNLLQPEMSQRLLERKVEELLSVDPDRVATGNPGCLMQIAQGLRDADRPLPVQHPIEILRESLSKYDSSA